MSGRFEKEADAARLGRRLPAARGVGMNDEEWFNLTASAMRWSAKLGVIGLPLAALAAVLVFR
jgi:hypothetical protein